MSVDVKRSWFGKKHVVHYRSGKNRFNLGLIDTLRFFEDKGAGEIIINSINHDGAMGGVDLDLIKKCSEVLTIPLVYVGGVGSISDIRDSERAGSSGTGAGSFFVYKGPRKAVLINYTNLYDD